MSTAPSRPMLIKTAGSTRELFCDSLNACCGSIEGGISVRFEGEGPFLISFDSWEEVYLAAKQLRADPNFVPASIFSFFKGHIQ